MPSLPLSHVKLLPSSHGGLAVCRVLLWEVSGRLEGARAMRRRWARSRRELRGPPEPKVCDSGDADFASPLSVTPVISVPNRRGPHFLLSALPTTRSFQKAARGAWLREGQSVFVTRE